jgi:hypothetical protein
MTHVVKLFGDIIAEEAAKGTYRVRKGENMVSPFEYSEIRQLTPKCWTLKRADETKEDILFDSGVWLFGTRYAYVLDRQHDKEDKVLIAAASNWGIDVFDEQGNHLAASPNHYRFIVPYDEFLVFFTSEGPDPEVKVYDLRGNLMTMGPLEKAIKNARRIMEILGLWA